MKKTMFAFCAVCCSLWLDAAENPVYALHPDDIAFHASFNAGDCNADMASGKAKPRRITGQATFANGVFGGKSLLTGKVLYDGVKNIDMSSPGTLIMWIAPVDWPAVKPVDGKEPGFMAFMAYAPEYGFYVSKISGQPWKHGHFNAYVQYPKNHDHVNCMILHEAITEKWKNGEWRMLAATWNNGTVTFSVNGKKSSAAPLKKLITTPTSWFMLGDMDPTGKYKLCTDELVILKKALNDAEIRKLYEESLKAVQEMK